jgi:hypothetical protein
MREVSRAIALDPENRDALRTLVRLFTRAPDVIPKEARRELAVAHGHSQRVGARTAALAYFSVLLYAPLAAWMGVRHAAPGAAYLLLWLACAGVSLYAGRQARQSPRLTDVVIVLSNAALALGCTMFGPFIMIPAIGAVNTVSFVVAGDRSRRALSIVLGCLAIAVPTGLEVAGLIPRSMVFRDGGIFVVPNVFAFPEVPTLAFLLAATVGAIATGALVIARFRDTLVKTEQRLYFQTWLLRQFVPDDVYDEVAPGTSESMSSLPRADPRVAERTTRS